MTQPTETDIKYLKDHPELADKYEQRFGEGSASAVLSPPQETQQENPSLLSQVGEAITNIPSDTVDIFRGLNAGAEGALNGVMQSLDSADKAISAKLDEYGIPSRLSLTDDEGNFSPSLNTLAESEGKPSILEARFEGAQQPETLTGRGVQGISQFLIGMAGAKKFTGIAGAKGAFVNGAIADGVVFDPSEGNLSNLMAENDMAVPLLTAAMATDPDDPEWLNRMRNVTEGAAMGGVADTVSEVSWVLPVKLKEPQWVALKVML